MCLKTGTSRSSRFFVKLLLLPYILLKTQGRSVNAFDNRNRVVYLPLPFAVPRSITGCSCKEYRRSAHRARGLNSTIK